VQLSPREEMDLIGVLADELGSGDAVARALGKSKAWVSKRRRIVGSPAFAAAVERGEIGVEHAYDVLAGATSEEDAVTQLERVRGGGETRAQTRTAKRSGRAASNGATSAPTADALDAAPVSMDAPATARAMADGAPTSVETGDVDRLDEPIDPRALSVARLIRKGTKVPRAIVLEALHTDLQALE